MLAGMQLAATAQRRRTFTWILLACLAVSLVCGCLSHLRDPAVPAAGSARTGGGAGGDAIPAAITVISALVAVLAAIVLASAAGEVAAGSGGGRRGVGGRARVSGARECLRADVPSRSTIRHSPQRAKSSSTRTRR